MTKRNDVHADMRKLLAVCLNATNDGNGNPRRVWAIIDRDGVTIDAIDEGYAGFDAVTSPALGYARPGGWYYPNAVKGPTYATTPAEYRHLLKHRERTQRSHWKVERGRCDICGHYGDDCTGDEAAS